jgi:hypothetical protein
MALLFSFSLLEFKCGSAARFQATSIITVTFRQPLTVTVSQWISLP